MKKIEELEILLFSTLRLEETNNPTNQLKRFRNGNKRNKNSDLPSAAKDSTQREKISYICGLRARIECEPFSEHSTHSDRVTDIGYLLSLGASPLPTANQI